MEIASIQLTFTYTKPVRLVTEWSIQENRLWNLCNFSGDSNYTTPAVQLFVLS